MEYKDWVKFDRIVGKLDRHLGPLMGELLGEQDEHFHRFRKKCNQKFLEETLSGIQTLKQTLKKDKKTKELYDFMNAEEFNTIINNYFQEGDFNISTEKTKEFSSKYISKLDDFRSWVGKTRPEKINNPNTLDSIFKDEDIQKIKSEIELQKVSEKDQPSYNKVFEAKNKSGEDLIIKISNKKEKAQLESAANFYLNQNPKLKNIIAKGITNKPIALDGKYLTIQEKIPEQNFSTEHYIQALALLHTYGLPTLKDKITIPNYKTRDFERVLKDLDKANKINQYRQFENQYNEIAEKLDSSSKENLIHGEPKLTNLIGGKLIDLETIKKGNPAIDLSLYLTQSDIPKDQWMNYINSYSNIVEKETKREIPFKDRTDLLNLTKDASLITSLIEIGGLYSRSKRKQEQNQLSQLIYNLNSN